MSTTIDSSFEADIRATFDSAAGDHELSERINTNIENGIISTLNATEDASDLKTVLDRFNSEFVNFKKEFPDASEPIWELHIETELLYQSDTVITIAISTYEFQGGAHGNDKIKFLNLNPQTGEVLDQNDIIDNRSAFKELAEKHFIKSIATKEDPKQMDDFFFGKPFQLPENIGFSEDGLVLLYNVYEITSYSQGYSEFSIPFEEVTPFLKVN